MAKRNASSRRQQRRIFLHLRVAGRSLASKLFDHLATVSIDNFEVIQTTGPAEGPRSPGAPTVNAGADQVIGIDDIATLSATSPRRAAVRRLAGGSIPDPHRFY